ncbi:unnamed protein product [Prorocentrum cordatum]|uniref:PDZ domain-containing protein n=1 Tax=Prorocentrum cordatum TaxID=2364126 RepID=A0ABN9SVL8_9DINO|nr:unnamed protein product [Polarella glacialis]
MARPPGTATDSKAPVEFPKDPVGGQVKPATSVRPPPAWPSRAALRHLAFRRRFVNDLAIGVAVTPDVHKALPALEGQSSFAPAGGAAAPCGGMSCQRFASGRRPAARGLRADAGAAAAPGPVRFAAAAHGRDGRGGAGAPLFLHRTSGPGRGGGSHEPGMRLGPGWRHSQYAVELRRLETSSFIDTCEELNEVPVGLCFTLCTTFLIWAFAVPFFDIVIVGYLKTLRVVPDESQRPQLGTVHELTPRLREPDEGGLGDRLKAGSQDGGGFSAQAVGRSGRAARLALATLLGFVVALVVPVLQRLASAPAFAQQPPVGRRDAALGAPLATAAALGALAGAPRGASAQAKQVINETVQDASAVIESLQNRWEALVAEGETVPAEEVTEDFKPFIETALTVTVPVGKSLDVDVEGLKLSGVRSKSLGWKKGDRIVLVNGQEVFRFDDVRDEIKKAKDANKPVVIKLERRQESPFARIRKALDLVYEQADISLSEPEDVFVKLNQLKNKAGLVLDGIGDNKGLRKKLDEVGKDGSQRTWPPCRRRKRCRRQPRRPARRTPAATSTHCSGRGPCSRLLPPFLGSPSWPSPPPGDRVPRPRARPRVVRSRAPRAAGQAAQPPLVAAAAPAGLGCGSEPRQGRLASGFPSEPCRPPSGFQRPAGGRTATPNFPRPLVGTEPLRLPARLPRAAALRRSRAPRRPTPAARSRAALRQPPPWGPPRRPRGLSAALPRPVEVDPLFFLFLLLLFSPLLPPAMNPSRLFFCRTGSAAPLCDRRGARPICRII